MKRYSKTILATLILIMATTGGQKTEAAIPIAIIKIIEAGVKKVIVAVDLQIQRQQNKIIWLQNAQKVIENTMSKLRLDEIGEWTERQKNLYGDYFNELSRVKSLITYYKRVREITEMQSGIVNEYRKVWKVISQDGNFSEGEKLYMAKVYAGILMDSAKNMEEMLQVVNSFRMQMSDAERLERIHFLANRVEVNYQDLLAFNRQNALVSLRRSKDYNATETIKSLYGIR